MATSARSHPQAIAAARLTARILEIAEHHRQGSLVDWAQAVAVVVGAGAPVQPSVIFTTWSRWIAVLHHLDAVSDVLLVRHDSTRKQTRLSGARLTFGLALTAAYGVTPHGARCSSCCWTPASSRRSWTTS